MAIRKVIRDTGGTIINVGDWDYQIMQEQRERTEYRTVRVKLLGVGGVQMLDQFGVPMTKEVQEPYEVSYTEDVITNPLPAGAYEDEADITIVMDQLTEH